jgi:hypothetical protein
MAWTITLNYQDGGGARDIKSLVDKKTFQRKRRIWNKLRPTVNTLTFRMKWDSTHMTLLMTTTKDILIVVKDDAGADYFYGIVKPNFAVNTGTRPEWIQVECVDRSWLLQKKIMTNINWGSYTVSNPAAIATSIVHQLMISAGYVSADISASIPTVAKTIANYIVIKGDTTYWQALEQITFEFGYTFYFTDAGTLSLYSFAPASVATTDALDNTNMIGTLGLKRSQREYDGARVKWYGLKTFTGVVVASDTSGGSGTYKALIAVLGGADYPANSGTYSTYIDYKYQDYEVVAVLSASLDLVKDAALSAVVFSDEIRRARIHIHNTDDAVTKYLYKFDVVGNAICKDTYNWTEAPSPLTSDKILEIDTRWISAVGDAQTLSDAVSRYYQNVSFTYTVRSRAVYQPGGFVDVTETSWLNIDNRCVVVEVVDNIWTGEYQYALEGITAYTAGTTSTSGTTDPVVIPKRTDGYTVAASGSTMDCDARCDGTADEVEINAAIVLVKGQGGGTVYLVGGTFNTTAAVVLDSNITLDIAPGSTIKKNGNFYAVECRGTLGANKQNITVSGGGTITQDSADTNLKALLYCQYIDNLSLVGIIFSKPYYCGIMVDHVNGIIEKNRISEESGIPPYRLLMSVDDSNGLTISQNIIIDCITATTLYGIAVVDSSDVIIEGNVISNLMSGYTCTGEPEGTCYGIFVAIGNDNRIINNRLTGVSSLGTTSLKNAISLGASSVRTVVIGNSAFDNGNLVDRGNCEGDGAGNEPHITADGGSVSNATFARSNVQKYAGTYSYLFTKTVAAGTAAYAWLVDNNTTTDMHTLSIKQGSYKLKAQVYVPAGAIDHAEVNLIVSQYYAAAWNDTLVACADTTDAWQAVEVTMTMDAACTGVRVGFVALAAAALNETFYVDNIQFIPMGVANEHQNNFYDAGTDTQVG